MDLCWQSNVSIFNTLSRLFIAWLISRLISWFISRLSKEKASFNFMATVTICSDFGAQENKFCHYFYCFPIEKNGRRGGGEGDDRGWNGWMASPTQWTWVWINCRSWWWTGKPGEMQSMGSQRVGHDWVTEPNLTDMYYWITFAVYLKLTQHC